MVTTDFFGCVGGCSFVANKKKKRVPCLGRGLFRKDSRKNVKCHVEDAPAHRTALGEDYMYHSFKKQRKSRGPNTICSQVVMSVR